MRRCDVCWKRATICSNSSNLPALSDSSAALRLAPTAKGASCQMTSASIVLLRLVDGAVEAGQHFGAERVHLALDGNDGDAVALVPQAHALVLEDRGALVGRLLAENQLREELARVDRQRRARVHRVVCGRKGTLRPVHALAAVGHPAGQRHAWPSSCLRRCPRRSSRPPAASRLPATARTAPSSSRTPSGWRSPRRARNGRFRPGARRSSGTGRGRWPTGTAPADAGRRATWRTAAPATSP